MDKDTEISIPIRYLIIDSEVSTFLLNSEWKIRHAMKPFRMFNPVDSPQEN